MMLKEEQKIVIHLFHHSFKKRRKVTIVAMRWTGMEGSKTSGED